MVAMFVNGVKVGTLDEAAAMLPKFLAERQTVQFRDETGEWLKAELKPLLLPPSITEADLARIVYQRGDSTNCEV